MTDTTMLSQMTYEKQSFLILFNRLQDTDAQSLGFAPGIHVNPVRRRDVDGRDKPGHDVLEAPCAEFSRQTL